MLSKTVKTDAKKTASEQNLVYIRQLLGELRQIAERENAEMLAYLIEMAYVEAGDLQTSQTTGLIRHSK